MQDEHLYSETTPVTHNYSTAGPGYEYTTINELVIDNYDVIGHNQPRLNKAKAANPPPVRDEAIENQDDFHNAEQYFYTGVNKKSKKRHHLTRVHMTRPSLKRRTQPQCWREENT